MVPKPSFFQTHVAAGFRAVLFRMVPKLESLIRSGNICFRAVLFRMVPKQSLSFNSPFRGFRAVLFRMVPKQIGDY